MTVFLQPRLHTFFAEKLFTVIVACGLHALKIQNFEANPANVFVNLIFAHIFDNFIDDICL